VQSWLPGAHRPRTRIAPALEPARNRTTQNKATPDSHRHHPLIPEEAHGFLIFNILRAIYDGNHLTEDDARAIIHTLRVAIDRIIEVSEFWGEQIGTKGFMK
jgi:hypothetical protein